MKLSAFTPQLFALQSIFYTQQECRAASKGWYKRSQCLGIKFINNFSVAPPPQYMGFERGIITSYNSILQNVITIAILYYMTVGWYEKGKGNVYLFDYEMWEVTECLLLG